MGLGIEQLKELLSVQVQQMVKFMKIVAFHTYSCACVHNAPKWSQNVSPYNYEIIQSQVYIVENTPNFNTSNEIEYNNPAVATPDGVNTFRPTYKTYYLVFRRFW